INFQDIKSIYAILHSAVKQAIGKFSLSPTLDFETEQSMNFPPIPENQPIRQPVITINPDYNPFEKKTQPQTSFSFPQKPAASFQGWRELYQTQPPSAEIIEFPVTKSGVFSEFSESGSDEPGAFMKKGVQVQNSFVVTNTKSGIIVIDQQHAHERVLYERYLEENRTDVTAGQHQLIPQTFSLSPDDAQFFNEWKSYFHKLGFEIDDFGKGTFVIHTIPMNLETTDIKLFIESVLESLKSPAQEHKMDQSQLLAKTMAKKLSIKRGKKLFQEEIDALIENLFACKVPEVSPEGKPTMLVLSYDELNTKFKI
ncbi:MAG: hypothetical protein NTW16_07245, partial [Bacteroidetes bacterium]|nr:hypothetical protein [Bacteroidota bacterium]